MIPAGLCIPKTDAPKLSAPLPVNTKADWLEAVADGKTELSFDAWMRQQKAIVNSFKKTLK